MITHLQTYFQKHFRWVFTILLVAMVIPFIFAYGPGSRLAQAHHHMSAASGNTFFGHDLSDEAHVQELSREAAIDTWLKTGNPPYDPQALQALVLARIVQMDLVERLGIPTPTADDLSAYIATLPAFQDSKGYFSQAKFNELQTKFIKEEGLSKDYLMDRIVDRWKLEQLASRTEGSAFFLPTTVEREYALMMSKYTVLVAQKKAANDNTVTISDDEAKKYFAANKASYATEEKREGVIYKMPADKFVSKVEDPKEEQLQKFFDQISFRFIQWQVTDEKGNVTGAAPKAPTLAEHREETVKLFKQMKASRLAAEVVDAVAQKIYSDKMTPGSKAWQELIDASGLEEQKIPAVTKTDKAFDEDTLNTLFSRSLKDQPYSEAFQTDTDGRFLLLTKVEPSVAQSFEMVAAKVKADALALKKQKLSAEKLEAAVAELKKDATPANFAELATKAGFTVSSPEAFTLDKPAAVLTSPELLKELLKTKMGGAVTMSGPDDALVVLLKDRVTPSFDAKSEQALILKAQIDRVYRSLGGFSYLNEWADLHGKK